MKKIKMLVMGLVAIAAMGLTAICIAEPASAAYNCPQGTLRHGKSVDNPTQCNIDPAEDDTLMTTVQGIINFALSVLGIVAVIVIIVGGVTYTTSLGDPGKITKAKNTILYGIIGLVVALLAFAVVNFVLDGVFNPKKGADTTEVDDTSEGDS